MSNRRVRGVENDFSSETENDDQNLREGWVKNFWYPVQQIGINNNTYIFKEKDKLICYDIYSNTKKWEVTLDLDASNKGNHINYHQTIHSDSKNKRVPLSEIEVLNFSDQIGSQLQIINDLVFTIVGHEKTGLVAGRNNRFWTGGNQRSIVGSILYGVDPNSGKKVFRLGHSSNKEVQFQNIVFVGLPVHISGDRYGILYSKGSELFISLVDKRGRGIWHKVVSSYEDSSFMYVDNAKCVYENGFFYISTGFGLVAKIEAEMGQYVWASNYERQIDSRAKNSYQVLSEKDGFEQNDMIVKNGVVFVAPPDAKQLICFDDETGEMVLTGNADHFSGYSRYLIGFEQDGILSCGEKGIRKYSYENLEELWTSEIEKIYSRPLINGSCVVAPSENNIYMLNITTGVKLKKFKISQSDENFKLGNLYIAKDLILSVGFDSLMVCGNLSSRIDSLSHKITDENDMASVFNRAELYFKIKDYRHALADYFYYIENFEDAKDAFEVKNKIAESLFKAGLEGDVLLVSEYIEKLEALDLGINLSAFYAHLLKKDISDKNYKNIVSYSEKIFKNFGGDKKQLVLSKHNNGSKVSPWFFSLQLLLDVSKKEPTVKKEFDAFVLSNSHSINMSFLIHYLDLSDDMQIKKELVKSYLKKNNEDIWNAKEHVFMRYLKKSSDPEFKSIGEYLHGQYLLELGSFDEFESHKNEFMNALKKLPTWFKDDFASLAVTKDFLNQLENLNGFYKPSVKIIQDPPLVEHYKLGGADFDIMKLGVLTVNDRSEYLERVLFYQNIRNHQVVCVDLLTGKKIWVTKLDQPENKAGDSVAVMGVRSSDIMNLDLVKRSYDIASVLSGSNILALDLTNGNKVHELPLAENEYLLSMSEEYSLVFDYKTKELFAYTVSDGFLVWGRTLNGSIGYVKTVGNKIVVMDESFKQATVINLKNGSILIEKSFQNPVDGFVQFEEDRFAYISRGRLYVCDLKTLQVLWSLDQHVWSLGSLENIQATKTHYFVRTASGGLLKVSKETGAVEWQIKLPATSNGTVVNFTLSSNGETIYIENVMQMMPKSFPVSNYVYSHSAKDGSLLQTFEFVVGSNEDFNANTRRNALSIFDRAVEGDVIPDLKRDRRNNFLLSFIRKRDAKKSDVFELKVDNFTAFRHVFFKGPLLFFRNTKSVVAYGNKESIEKILTLREEVKEKYKELKKQN